MEPVIQKIGGVILDSTYYDPKDIYNEGDEAEDLVLSVLKNRIDPKEVLSKDDRWPILYQLSDRRKNIAEPMDLRPGDRVLEIGAGMGAVSGAIAARCGHLDCVELSQRRCLANAYRNQDHSNIRIYNANFENVPLREDYDVVVMIGVLEYAGSYMHSEQDPYLAMLKKIRGCLKPNGRIYIAIENRLGLKYFAGCSEDHYGKPFIGIEGYPSDSRIRTFSRSELKNLVSSADFQDVYFYYPFPDYKLPTVIYSDDFLPADGLMMDLPNYDQPRLKIFDDQRAFHSLAGSEELKALSNSFLLEAVKR